MNSLTGFAQALLSSDATCPAGLTTWNSSDPARRFAVYRNNVMVSLIEAMADTYPVVRALVGDEFFRDMARVFARTYPPRTPVMAHYGESFADFIQNYDPAASVPYLPDVARLEWAYVCAFHAADVAPVPTQSLLELIADAERLAANRCQLHPSLRVVSSDYAVASLWAAHQGDLDIGRVDPWKAESALVLRNGLTVEIREVSPGGATFFNRLIQGEPLAQAVQAADAPGSGFALEDCLGLLIQSSAIVAIETSEATLT